MTALCFGASPARSDVVNTTVPHGAFRGNWDLQPALADPIFLRSKNPTTIRSRFLAIVGGNL